MGSNKAIKVAGLLIVVVAAAAFLIGPKPDTNKPGGQVSPEVIAASGATTTEIVDPTHERQIEILTWAPSGPSVNSLIVLSHGFGGHPTSHGNLAADLAARGYTVAAPTHPDLAGLESGNPDLDPLVLRPRHLRLTIEEMSNRNDESFDSVSIIGHSIGAYGALVAVGATPSAQRLEAHCVVNPSDEVLCSDNARRRIDMIAGTVGPVENGKTETKVDHIVLLAPGYGPLFTASDLSPVSSTVLIAAASDDQEISGDQVNVLASSLPGATLETYTGGHYVFLRPCTATEKSNLPELCVDPVGSDRVAVKDDLVDKVESLDGMA